MDAVPLLPGAAAGLAARALLGLPAGAPATQSVIPGAEVLGARATEIRDRLRGTDDRARCSAPRPG
ncbi:hypothetical protein ACIQXD_02560 [Streptomyces uncialis]|uniref:hypothetical protein n=1 Tax=Streptomyces uncialis TaxID=1048205 RepID=UPI003824C819